MRRLLALTLVLFVPHLVEEALTQMHDDPMMAAALAPFAELTSRHAAYLVFQLMLVLTLGVTLLFSLDGKARLLVMAALGVALVAEGHHLVRALFSLHYQSGLLTAFPMPLFGGYLLRRVVLAWRGPA